MAKLRSQPSRGNPARRTRDQNGAEAEEIVAAAIAAAAMEASIEPDLMIASSPPPKRRSKRKHGDSAADDDSKSALKKERLEPMDRLSPLSSELIALVMEHLSPSDAPDPTSLRQVALCNKALLPHARQALYRHLKITTRISAHAMHRSLHGRSELNKAVRIIDADVGVMAKTSSQWTGWFLFHSMHSLCGIIGSCRQVQVLNLYLPSGASAWTQSLCTSLVDLKLLHTLNKDLEPSGPIVGRGSGAKEGMDVGWRVKKSMSMWSVSQFLKPLLTLKALHTLRICGIASDSSTTPPSQPHSCMLQEVVLIGVDITNTDLLHILGNASSLKRFTLWRSSLLSKRGLSHVLKKCPNLVELKIGGSWFGAKDEDDLNFPLDTSIAHLPHLRIVYVSGSLISPAILLHPSTNLKHLLVTNCPSFTPQAVHSALVKMPSDPILPVQCLTLPELSGKEFTASGRESVSASASRGSTRALWDERWKFTVRATCEAKGVVLNDGGRRAGGGADRRSVDEGSYSSDSD